MSLARVWVLSEISAAKEVTCVGTLDATMMMSENAVMFVDSVVCWMISNRFEVFFGSASYVPRGLRVVITSNDE